MVVIAAPLSLRINFYLFSALKRSPIRSPSCPHALSGGSTALTTGESESSHDMGRACGASRVGLRYASVTRKLSQKIFFDLSRDRNISPAPQTETAAVRHREFGDELLALRLGYPAQRPPIRRGRSLPEARQYRRGEESKAARDSTARFYGL